MTVDRRAGPPPQEGGRVVPNYALTIIIVTLIIRVLLLPFGFKQIKSMQHMQALQPKIKDLQRKYKNNKQKQQEETMKLYKEAGVNPLGGCLPMLLTLPFLFAMYAVIRPAALAPDASQPGSFIVTNNHLPEDSTLFYDVLTHQNLDFLSVNLQCSLSGAGTQVPLKDTQGQQLPEDAPILGADQQVLPNDPVTQSNLDCGTKKFPDAIPYVVLLLLMIGTAFYQQRQMQKANPPNAQTGQQQAIMKYLPLMYGVWGWLFPAGLIMYWTTSNALQIAQQTVMLRAGHIGPDALERRMAEQREKMANGAPKRKGIMGWMSEKAEVARAQQDQVKKPAPPAGGKQPNKRPTGGSPKTGSPKPGSSKANNAKPSKGAKPGNQLKPKKKS